MQQPLPFCRKNPGVSQWTNGGKLFERNMQHTKKTKIVALHSASEVVLYPQNCSIHPFQTPRKSTSNHPNPSSWKENTNRKPHESNLKTHRTPEPILHAFQPIHWKGSVQTSLLQIGLRHNSWVPTWVGEWIGWMFLEVFLWLGYKQICIWRSIYAPKYKNIYALT